MSYRIGYLTHLVLNTENRGSSSWHRLAVKSIQFCGVGWPNVGKGLSEGPPGVPAPAAILRLLLK